MILEVLKYILVVLGIIAVGAFIIWGLVSLILVIVEPHGNKEDQNTSYRPYEDRSMTYNQQNYTQNQPIVNQYIPQEQQVQEYVPEQQVQEYVPEQQVQEYVPENTEIKELDYQKAIEEEKALSNGTSFGELSAEEEEFIREKQRKIEERMAAKTQEVVVEENDELNLDDIFIDDESAKTNEVTTDYDNDEDDIEALINKILDGEDELDDSFLTEEQNIANEEVEEIKTEEIQEIVEEQEETAEESVEEVFEGKEAQESVIADEEETVDSEETMQEVALAETENTLTTPVEDERVKELEDELARQKEEYESKLQEIEQSKEIEQENSEKIAALQAQLEEKDRQIKEAEQSRVTGPTLAVEEYEQRLEILKERLKNNERDLKVVKKEYLPLAKIKKTLEKDNKKLRRKEALVAKQKVVLYGVNNYVDIDEEKAKKLAEDLDLLEGLRLSVAHCEEVMKANAERYPLLENSYNILIENNMNIKADIEDCQNKIAILKSSQE